MFNISGQNVNFVPGCPQKLAHSLYALSTYAFTSLYIDRFSNLFYCLSQKNICNNTISPHLKCVATLPFGMSVFKSNNWKKDDLYNI